MRLRRAARAVLAAALALGCQSIAGVQDVSFDGQGSACDSYCDTLMEACPGDVAVYEDDAMCRRACAQFKSGSTAKPQGNTLACRAAQAELAYSLKDDLSENRSNCAAAGPGGGDKCTLHAGDPDCEGYCTIYMAACTSISKEWGFDTFDECTARCAAFPFNGSYAISTAQAGDTLACRLYHATLALEDPDNYCKSGAGLRPTGECSGSGEPDCDDYCRVNDVACQGQYKAYESIRQCKAVCEATPKGSREDGGMQDTVGCRQYHSYFALMGAPTPHCSHSGPAGDGICSDDEKHPNCNAFCRLLKTGCSAKFGSVFGGEHDACVEDCETLDDATVEGGNLYSIERAQKGNTLKCRTLYVARAVTDPESPDAAKYCGSALGESPCN